MSFCVSPFLNKSCKISFSTCAPTANYKMHYFCCQKSIFYKIIHLISWTLEMHTWKGIHVTTQTKAEQTSEMISRRQNKKMERKRDNNGETSKKTINFSDNEWQETPKESFKWDTHEKQEVNEDENRTADGKNVWRNKKSFNLGFSFIYFFYIYICNFSLQFQP